MIQLTPHEDGVCLPIRAQGGARQTGLRGEHGGALKATVTQVPEKGKANKAIHALLCRELGLRRGHLAHLLARFGEKVSVGLGHRGCDSVVDRLGLSKGLVWAVR